MTLLMEGQMKIKIRNTEVTWEHLGRSILDKIRSPEHLRM